MLLWATTNVGSLLPGCSSSHLRDLKQPLEVLHLSITLCPSSDLEQPRSCIAMDFMAAHAVRHCTWETATLHRSSIPSHLHPLSWSNGAKDVASGILDLRGLTPSSRQTLQAGRKSATIETLAQMQFDKPISFVFGKELGAVWVLQHVTTSPSS